MIDGHRFTLNVQAGQSTTSLGISANYARRNFPDWGNRHSIKTRCKINLTYQSQNPPNLKVVEMVLNTQCYQYLWLTM